LNIDFEAVVRRDYYFFVDFKGLTVSLGFNYFYYFDM